MRQQREALDAWAAYIRSQDPYGAAKEAVFRKDVPAPFVTISRETGAGGISVGEELIKFLNHEDRRAGCPWVLFDKNLLDEVLKENFLPEMTARFMPEAKVSELKSLLEELIGLHPSNLALFHRTNETILHLAALGHAVIVGRGANLVTRGLEQGFHARLIAPLAARIRRVQDHYRMGAAAAADFIRKEDEGRRDYVRSHFGKDINDPLYYDLVVNAQKLGFRETAGMIGRAVLAFADKMRVVPCGKT